MMKDEFFVKLMNTLFITPPAGLKPLSQFVEALRVGARVCLSELPCAAHRGLCQAGIYPAELGMGCGTRTTQHVHHSSFILHHSLL